ncbi:M56 family metallopeptidase [Albibacterium bauzanense]|uniref:M56 family metallopeptidase n=1 Tax=Albibacterium bauzanense TaxID=653929 RepID=UPI0014045DE7|nr:M56 family metallopeptidase [Albibacterium bauzanense]
MINLRALLNKSLEIPAEVMTVLPDLNSFQFAQQGIEFNQIIDYLLWFSFVIVFLSLLIKLWGVLRIHLNSVQAHWTIYSYRKSQEDIAPFSFWKSIYLNPDKHGKDEFDKILKHEYIHIRQLHSLDTLIAEIALMLFWYNPVCWFIRQAIHENVEFITDQKVLATGIDKQNYQYSLLNISILPTGPALGNHFNIKSLKKRIKMMNKKQTSNKHLSKYVFILPIAIMGSLIFSFSNAEETIMPSTLSDNLIHVEGNMTAKQEQDSLTADKKPIGDGISENVLIFLDGIKISKEDLNKVDPEDIESMNVYKGESTLKKFGEEGKDGAIEITTKANKKK